MMIAEDIRGMIAAFEQAQSDFREAYGDLNICSGETLDIIRSFEFDDFTPSEQGELATRFRRALRMRRKNKDIVQTYEPLFLFLDSERGKDMLNLLREALEKTKGIEELHRTQSDHKRTQGEDE